MSPKIVRQIIKDNSFHIILLTNYDSTVVTRYSKDKQFKFQIENGLAMVTDTINQKELFCPSKQIKNYINFSVQNFEEIISKKQKITPVNQNIQDSLSDSFNSNLFE